MSNDVISNGSFGILADNMIEDRIHAMFKEQQRRLHSKTFDNGADEEEALDLKVRSKRVKTENGDTAAYRERERPLSANMHLNENDRVAGDGKKLGAFPCSQCHKTFSAEVDLKGKARRESNCKQCELTCLRFRFRPTQHIFSGTLRNIRSFALRAARGSSTSTV